METETSNTTSHLGTKKVGQIEVTQPNRQNIVTRNTMTTKRQIVRRDREKDKEISLPYSSHRRVRQEFTT